MMLITQTSILRTSNNSIELFYVIEVMNIKCKTAETANGWISHH